MSAIASATATATATDYWLLTTDHYGQATMGHRELFLVLVSIVLLTALMTQINSNIAVGREALQELEIEHAAEAVAQQFIEEAKSKDFDNQVGVITAVQMPAFFTLALAPEGGQVHPNFNDVDDYNGLIKNVSVQGINFHVEIDVVYVQDADPELAVLGPTFFKKMTVRVSSSWLHNTVTLKHVFSFFGVDL